MNIKCYTCNSHNADKWFKYKDINLRWCGFCPIQERLVKKEVKYRAYLEPLDNSDLLTEVMEVARENPISSSFKEYIYNMVLNERLGDWLEK